MADVNAQSAPVDPGAVAPNPAVPLRLIFVTPHAPRRDATHGSGRVLAQLIARIAVRHRVAVVYLRLPGAPAIEDELARACELVEEVAVEDGALRSRWRHRLNVLAAPITGRPSPVAPLHQPRLAAACAELAAGWSPHVIQVEHDTLAYCGPVLRERVSGAIRVLTAHDPGVAAARQQAEATRGRQRLAHRVDAWTWRRYWTRTLVAFDAIIAFTGADRDVLEELAPRARVAVIGVGTEIPARPLNAAGHGPLEVVFVGNYVHPPNADAALRLIRSIMPRVRARLAGIRLTLVGIRPPAELVAAAGPDDVVTGAVARVEPYADRASVLAFPIRLGGGMRVKVLESLASGKAVVASRLAIAGLEVESGNQVRIAESDDEFADAIVALLEDEPGRRQLAENAREWAQRNLGWDQRVEQYEALYRSLVEASPER